MILALDKKYVTIIQTILNKHAPNKIVWVYGSRVNGKSHEGSDIDLVFAPSTESLPEKKLSALKAAFSESALPILVDIVNWDDIPESFQTEIKKMHVIFPLKE